MADAGESGTLDPGAQQFVEGMGLYFERFGIPRIGGRILGLLMMADHPLTLDDMKDALGVSRASISTNARMSVAAGAVQHVSLPGRRHDYYVFSADAWERRLQVSIPGIQWLRDLAEQGLAALAPENSAGRARLTELIEFCDFYQTEMEEMIARWRARRAEAGRTSTRPGHAAG